MVEIPSLELPLLYADLMRQIVRRRKAIDRALKRATEDKTGLEAAIDLEFCFLQIRMSIELMALAALVAHNEIAAFRKKDLMKAWHADDLLRRLMEISSDAFPRRVSQSPVGEDGVADLFIHDEPEARSAILQIYGQCGDRLHTGSLRSLLKQGGRTYDAREVVAWRNYLVEFLNEHVVMLPNDSRMMVTFLLYRPTMDVHCFLTSIRKGSVVHPNKFPPTHRPLPTLEKS